jgi:serine/threonine protein kinase
MSDEDFKGIVSNMARLRHANIVELHGYCVQHGQRLLAFQYFPEGNLFDFLQDPKRRPYLTWEVRVRIAIGCARGLEYV